MKVLLTGANGFVGSHILDQLRARGIPVAVLLRPGSDTRFIQSHLSDIEVHRGSAGDRAALAVALRDATDVIHCAGCTKALRRSEFYAVNRGLTRQVAEAVAARNGRIRRLVYISSLAAGGPAVGDHPSRESDAPGPVSDYGRSKLEGEREVRALSGSEFVIVRPPAVYGPRDTAFLALFKALRAHVLPRFGGGAQQLSFVYAADLAEAVVICLTHPAAAGKTYYAAGTEVASAAEFGAEIGRQMGVWAVPLPLPLAALWPLCCAQEVLSRLTRKPSVLSRQKYAELRARGWVCDPSLLQRETGYSCGTTLRIGIGKTLEWYRDQGWL